MVDDDFRNRADEPRLVPGGRVCLVRSDASRRRRANERPTTRRAWSRHKPKPRPARRRRRSSRNASPQQTESSAESSAEETESGDAEEGGEGGETEEAEASEAPTADGEAAKKKRRRKKKKKKAPGEAGAEGAAAHEGGDRHERPHRGSRPATERAPFHVGEEVFGKVTAVLDTAIMVDLSGKALAIFDRTEMEPDDLVPGVGDRFVARVHNDGARGGLVVLTRKPLREEEAKPLRRAGRERRHGSEGPDHRRDQGRRRGRHRGAARLCAGLGHGFAPAKRELRESSRASGSTSRSSSTRTPAATWWSRADPMLEAEAHERRKHALALLTEGQVLKGVVRTVVEWGAFVALPEAENLEGLVHVTEATHDARARLTDLFKPGDPIDVKILKIDEKGKIWLSHKALIEDPWAAAREKYAPGSRHEGKVLRLLDFGAFVELEPGVEGLIHVADLSLNRIEHPKEVLNEGQDLDVVVHRFDPRDKKIGLHPAPPPERADEPAQKIAKGAVVKVEIIKHEAAGLIVRILGVTGRAARGFLPAGQTGTPRGTDLKKSFKLGSEIDAKVIDVDPRRHEPKLSVKALAEDEERRAHKEYRQALQREGGFGTLGDLLSAKLKGLRGEKNE